MTVIVDEKNFKEDVLQSETPVLVDFYAEWCGPCKALMPTIEEIAIEYAEKIKAVNAVVSYLFACPDLQRRLYFQL